MKPKKKTRDLPTCSKWQIRLGQWQKVARRETERSAASAKRAVTPHRGIPKGTALGAPLVTFPATGKSPGFRAWLCHALAERLQLVGAGTTSPAKAPRGAKHGKAMLSRSALWGVQRGRSPLASSSRSCGAERPLNPPLLFGIYRKEDKFFLSSTKTFCRNASPLCNTREIQKTLETAPFSSYNENRILPPGSLLHRAEEIGKTRRI